MYQTTGRRRARPSRGDARAFHPGDPGPGQRRGRARRVQQAQGGLLGLPAAVLAGARRVAVLPAPAGQQPVRGDADLPPSASPNSCSIPRTSRPGSGRGCGATRCASTSPSSTSASRRRSTPPCSAAARRIKGIKGARCARGIVGLPAFLAGTCLSYCEFYELWQSGFVAFRNGADEKRRRVPAVRAVLPGRAVAAVPRGAAGAGPGRRCWCSSGCGASCASRAASATRSRSCGTSATCCSLYQGGALNPDFVRQLAAFQMLRDDFGMDLADPAAPVRAGRDRRGPHAPAGAVGRAGRGAVAVGGAAADHPGRTARAAAARLRAAPAEFVKLLAANLDPLSRLAGFDPARPPTPGTRGRRTRCGSPRCWRRSTPPTSASAS